MPARISVVNPSHVPVQFIALDTGIPTDQVQVLSGIASVPPSMAGSLAKPNALGPPLVHVPRVGAPGGFVLGWAMAQAAQVTGMGRR